MESTSLQTSPISATLIHKDSLRADFSEFFENYQSRPGDSLGNYALSEYGRRFVKEGREYSTFLVTNTPEGGYLENIVFSNGATSERTFLVRYDLTETEKEQIRNWEHVPLEGKIVSFDELEDGTMIARGVVCFASFEVVSICTHGNHEDGAYPDGSDCPRHHETLVIEINCIGGGDVPDGSIPSSLPDTGGGGGGDGDGPSGPDYEVITIPVVPSPFQLFLTTLDLDQSQLEWLENHPLIITEIKNFLDTNSYSAESMAFAEEAIVVLINGGEVDFEERVIYDDSFINTETKCIHDKLKNGNTFYGDMIEHFNNPNLPNFLIYEMGNAPVGDWAITSSYSAGNDNLFLITTDTDLENKSNLAKMVTLSHELIHAYMFDFLEDEGIIYFDGNGFPRLDVASLNCDSSYNNINLNTLSTTDRFIALLCAMEENGTLGNNFTHELFNSPTFEITDYRMLLEQLIFNEYDWNADPQVLKNEMIQQYGSDWKQEVAGLISWEGLTETQEFVAWAAANGYPTGINSEGETTCQDLSTVLGAFDLMGNQNCN